MSDIRTIKDERALRKKKKTQKAYTKYTILLYIAVHPYNTKDSRCCAEPHILAHNQNLSCRNTGYTAGKIHMYYIFP